MEQTTIDKNKVIDDLLLLVAIKNKNYDTLKQSHENLMDACRAGGIELEFCHSNHEMDTPEMKVLLDTLAMIEHALEEAEKIGD